MTILTAGLGEHLPVGEAAVLALLGYAVVFFGIVLLMAVVMAMGRVFIARDKKAAAIKEAAHAAAHEVAAQKDREIAQLKDRLSEKSRTEAACASCQNSLLKKAAEAERIAGEGYLTVDANKAPYIYHLHQHIPYN